MIGALHEQCPTSTRAHARFANGTRSVKGSLLVEACHRGDSEDNFPRFPDFDPLLYPHQLELLVHPETAANKTTRRIETP
jgi:hypothetical protein